MAVFLTLQRIWGIYLFRLHLPVTMVHHFQILSSTMLRPLAYPADFIQLHKTSAYLILTLQLRFVIHWMVPIRMALLLFIQDRSMCKVVPVNLMFILISGLVTR